MKQWPSSDHIDNSTITFDPVVQGVAIRFQGKDREERV